MRADQAQTLQLGDRVIDTFSMDLIVKSIKSVRDHNEELLHILVITEDKNGIQDTNHHEDVYLPDLDGVGDEEKSWLNWAKKNQDFLEEFDHLSSVRLIYMNGFANGFEHKRKISFEEMMQK